MQIFTFDLNTQESDLNDFLEDNARAIKDVHFMDGKAVVATKDAFCLADYVAGQIEEAEDALMKKEYELSLLKSYSHIEKEKIQGAKEGAETEIKTLKAKIKTSNECLRKLSKK